MSQSKEQDESIAVVYMVVSVGADLHSHNLCMYIHTLCGGGGGVVSIGNTSSDSLLVEQGNMEEKQPFVSQATRLSSS